MLIKDEKDYLGMPKKNKTRVLGSGLTKSPDPDPAYFSSIRIHAIN
jgi:hypothetical protein